MEMKKDTILLVEEAADLIGIKPSTVYQWAHKQKRGWIGGVKVHKAGDGKLYLRRSEAEKYAAEFRPERITQPEYEDPDSPWMDEAAPASFPLPGDADTESDPRGGE